ncbi:RNA-directed DNA polymerase from mobile element jockey [Trichonephila clavata]|uniref:RNA-directed DNA polymerase from mobile element jockey n=1 Tax=Trichonephila clavata TaxID=2740835 RepID=A0A8X6M4Z7_TRICU|nr:RNA-directed DNA polymerase from mobile element jockey [Trichonephila clavata]
MDKNTIILGDFNAKYTIWGSSCNNDIGEDILQMMDNKEFMILNDGTSNHSFFSYNASEALDMSITSANIFPQCTGFIIDHIGSDHFLIFIQFSKRQRVVINRDKFWIFKKANWDSFRESVDTFLASEPMTEYLTHSWKTVLDKASSNISSGNAKHYVPYFVHDTSTFSPTLKKRKRLLKNFKQRTTVQDPS